MKREKAAVFFALILFLLSSGVAFGADIVEEKEIAGRATGPKESMGAGFLAKGKVKSFTAVTLGFDNNVFLDGGRHKDGFSQFLYRGTYTWPLEETLNGILELNIMDLTYFDSSEASLIAPSFRGGLDFKLDRKTNLIVDYSFGLVDFIDSGANDFYDHKFGVTLKQRLPLKFSHAFSYEFLLRDYMERKTRDSATVYREESRMDERNTLEYSISKQFPQDLWKVGLTYYQNNSNEKYLDYYDVDSWKPFVSVTHLFGPKLFGYAAFSRQFRYYAHRTAIGSANKEEDTTNVFSQALFYTVNKSFTLGVSHTLRKNDSNEPTSRYSGSVISINGYYTF